MLTFPLIDPSFVYKSLTQRKSKFKNPFDPDTMATNSACSGEGCTSIVGAASASILTISTLVDGETLEDQISLE